MKCAAALLTSRAPQICVYFTVLGDTHPRKHIVKLTLLTRIAEKHKENQCFKLRLSWLALAPQVWSKNYSEALFEAFKLTVWLSLARSLALSGPLWKTRSLSGTLWLTLWLSLAHSGSLWLTLAHSGPLWFTLAAHSGSHWLTLAHSASRRLWIGK